MSALGKKLWELIEAPQGEAFICDAIVDEPDAHVVREAEVRLAAARRVVSVLTAFVRANKLKHAQRGD